MRSLLVASLLLGTATSAHAQVSISVGLPSVQIGVNVPVYPELVQVPGYPVYYDPRGSQNYFFYDGAYWVYEGDSWYVSSWYDGPWQAVGPEAVPLYVLRVPVRYYRRPPPYFRGWHADAPPRWGEHWGRGWEDRRHGWDRWDHRAVPRPAPLPVYQRAYAGDRYPSPEHQRSLWHEQYRYQPREEFTRQRFGVPVRPGFRGGPGGEPQRMGPPGPRQLPPPPRDDGMRNDREPHERGRGHDDGRGYGGHEARERGDRGRDDRGGDRDHDRDRGDDRRDDRGHDHDRGNDDRRDDRGRGRW